MNKVALVIIFIFIISFFILYKHTYKTIENFTTIEHFEDTNNENTDINENFTTIEQEADIQEQQEQNNQDSIRTETNNNAIDLAESSSYLKTLNDILTNRIDVSDSKLSNKLKNFETNEINFHTIQDESGVPGSMNICNTKDGKLMCSHIGHTDGSTYIRPGVENADVWINKAKNINIHSNESTDIVGRNIYLRGVNVEGNTTNNSINLNTNNTNICKNGMCSHLPYTNGNTYIRPGNVDGDVLLGKHGNNVRSVEANAKSVDLCSSISGKCSHFPWGGDQNTYIRPGKKEGIIYLGNDVHIPSNDNGTSEVRAVAKSNKLCSNQNGARCSEFPATNGDTIIRSGVTGKSIIMDATNFCFRNGNKVVCFTVEELEDIKKKTPVSTTTQIAQADTTAQKAAAAIAAAQAAQNAKLKVAYNRLSIINKVKFAQLTQTQKIKFSNLTPSGQATYIKLNIINLKQKLN